MDQLCFKSILELQVTEVFVADRPAIGKEQEQTHYGIFINTDNSKIRYLLHIGPNYGKPSDFILTDAQPQDKWKMREIYHLQSPLTIGTLFKAGCCNQDQKYDLFYNNSKHAQERIIQKVQEYKHMKASLE